MNISHYKQQVTSKLLMLALDTLLALTRRLLEHSADGYLRPKTESNHPQ